MINAKELKKANDTYKESLRPKPVTLPPINSVIDLWKAKGEEVIEFMLKWHKDVASIWELDFPYPAGSTDSYFDGLSWDERKYFEKELARPFIEAGYCVLISLPRDEWSGGTSMKFDIGIPGTIPEECLTKID